MRARFWTAACAYLATVGRAQGWLYGLCCVVAASLIMLTLAPLWLLGVTLRRLGVGKDHRG